MSPEERAVSVRTFVRDVVLLGRQHGLEPRELIEAFGTLAKALVILDVRHGADEKTAVTNYVERFARGLDIDFLIREPEPGTFPQGPLQ